MTALNSPVLSTPPLLPTELIAGILRNRTLSKFDLARCCRVNNTFLALARPLLYHTIEVNLATKDDVFYDKGWTMTFLMGSCDQFLRTLKKQPSLGQLPRRLKLHAGLAGQPASEDEPFFDYRDEAIQFLLEAMPNVHSLESNKIMWESEEVRDHVFSRCERWSELDLEGWIHEDDYGADLSDWTNLRRLRCSGIAFNRTLPCLLPDGLEVLDLYAWNYKTFLKPANISPNSQLRILRISSSDLNLSTINILPRLEQLHFYAISGYPRILSSSTLSSFAKLPRLQLLSFRFDSLSQPSTLPLKLLSHLPPTLDRLEFPEYIPFQPLLDFLRSPLPSSVRTIGIARSAILASKIRREMSELFSACQAKNIQIEYISPDEDLFLA